MFDTRVMQLSIYKESCLTVCPSVCAVPVLRTQAQKSTRNLTLMGRLPTSVTCNLWTSFEV